MRTNGSINIWKNVDLEFIREQCMERTKELNGAQINTPLTTDVKTQFCLIDPNTGDRILIREMTDAQLASFGAGVNHVSKSKLQAVLTRLQLVLNPLDSNMCITMFEQALTNAALLLVLQYEQNRRANAAAPAEVPA
jgi:hypothetical protein